jgi:energy-coupling factor transporter ATP-binding protein EcfA2
MKEIENEDQNEPYFDVDISAQPEKGLPELKTRLGRVSVILGANGSGKSKLLSTMNHEAKTYRTMNNTIQQEGSTALQRNGVEFLGKLKRLPIFVAGGRATSVPGSENASGSSDLKTYFHEKGQWPRPPQVGTPIYSMYATLLSIDNSIESDFNQRVLKWANDDNFSGDRPIKAEPVFDVLFSEFNKILPDIICYVSGENKFSSYRQFRCQKNGIEYEMTELSDGEKQILKLLAEIKLAGLYIPSNEIIVFVDEPEQNLNPLLACRLWDVIEESLPDAIFVYASHCLSFAMRSNVSKIIVLNRRNCPPIEINNISELDSEEAKEFLGQIPGILSAPGALAVEASKELSDSFDIKFYKWLLGRNDIIIVPLGGCGNVQAASTHTGIWEKLASTAKILGVIDRDYKSEKGISEIRKECIVLKYHEVESYLCHPDTFYAVAKSLGMADPTPSVEVITDKIISLCSPKILSVAAKRMEYNATVRLSVSVERKDWTGVSDLGKLKKLVGEKAHEESEKVASFMSKDIVIASLEKEYEECENALQERDIEKILQLFPGKELLNSLAPLAHVKNSITFLNAAINHLVIERHPNLKHLREQLTSPFNEPVG